MPEAGPDYWTSGFFSSATPAARIFLSQLFFISEFSIQASGDNSALKSSEESCSNGSGSYFVVDPSEQELAAAGDHW